jgi:AraC-like DNA-binding protein/quercetin dioxygenase-like cupin family protein
MKDFLLKRYPLTRQVMPRSVTVMTTRYRHGERSTWHQHQHGQLAFATRGVVRVLTPARTWTLPPSRAVWLPSDIDHELHAVGEAELCNIYIEPEVFPWPWNEPTVIQTTPLLKELAIVISNAGECYATGSTAAISAVLLLKVLADLPALAESGVPLPQDRQLLAICEHLMNEPANDQSLDVWGERLGLSGRTLARRFKAETGLTFGTWRLQLRVAEAITRLALGETVGDIAKALKYSSTAAFVTMFRQITGDSPRRYIASN